MRQRIVAMLVIALTLWGVASVSANADWRDPVCEQDGSHAAGTADCTPPSDQPQPPADSNSCLGAVYCEATYEELDAAGFDTSDMRREDAEASTDVRLGLRPAAGSRRRLVYGGWAAFYNYNGGKCNRTVRDSGHCAWLYHKYRIFRNGDPVSQVRTTSFPARSGNDDPSDQWVRNLGPIPERFRASSRGSVRDDYRWGRMNGRFTGYESRSEDSWYPGMWRLDPWVVYKPHNPNHTRSSFEIHGGRNAGGSSRLWTTRTNGCIRLSISGIRGLKSKWDNRTDNRRTARVYVVHNP